jgi:hypothetical protein
MAQAIEMRQDTLMLISNHTEIPLADLQAMLENWQAFESDPKNPLVIVIDFNGINGYMPWAEMSKKIFDAFFRYTFEPINPNKFEYVHLIH